MLPSMSVLRFKLLTKLNKVLMDQRISPLQLFSFVCRVLKAYEVCPREGKVLDGPEMVRRYEWVTWGCVMLCLCVC